MRRSASAARTIESRTAITRFTGSLRFVYLHALVFGELRGRGTHRAFNGPGRE
jgi:hypothetical protein